jgi:hypothetical protein
MAESLGGSPYPLFQREGDGVRGLSPIQGYHSHPSFLPEGEGVGSGIVLLLLCC